MSLDLDSCRLRGRMSAFQTGRVHLKARTAVKKPFGVIQRHLAAVCNLLDAHQRQQQRTVPSVQILGMDLTEQRRLSVEAACGQDGALENGDASTLGSKHASPELAADVFLEVEVMNRTEHSVEVSLSAGCASPSVSAAVQT